MNKNKPNRKIGPLLVILLAVALFLLLYSIYKLNRQANLMVETAELVKNQRPDFNLVDNALAELYLVDNHFRFYLNSREEEDLRKYKQHFAQLNQTVEKLKNLMFSQEGESLAHSSTLLAIKKDVGEELSTLHRQMNDLLEQLGNSSPLQAFAYPTNLKKPQLDKFLEKIKSDTLIIHDTIYRKKLLARLTDAIQRGEDAMVEKAIIFAEESKSFYIVEETSARLIEEMHTHYRRQANNILLAKESFFDKEREFLETNMLLIADIQKAIQKARNIETLESEQKTLAGLNDIYASGKLVGDTNKMSMGIILFIIVIMIWFLRRSFNYENELLQIKEQAVAIADERTNFLASMSHEIRTPLNSIVGFTDLLGRTRLNHEQKEMLDAAKISAKVLLSMVNDILDIGKLESGQFKLRDNNFKPQEVLDYVVYTIELQAKTKSIPIYVHNELDEDLELIGDDLLLRQILLNLLSNAVKFTHIGQVDIFVTSKKEKSGLRLIIEVKDTGAGISQEKMDKLFQKYYSSDTDRQVGGTGLGLYICKLMTNIQNGEIFCKSKQGEGSTFTLIIPYKEAPGATVAMRAKENGRLQNVKAIEVEQNLSSQTSFIQGKHCLVVDDNPLNIKLMNLLLQKWGASMEGAADGKEGLVKLTENRYDLVLTDLMMPNMDGFELAEKMKNTSYMKDIPLIALTADIMVEPNNPKFSVFDTVVTKPINEEELFFKLVAILSQAEIRKKTKYL